MNILKKLVNKTRKALIITITTLPLFACAEMMKVPAPSDPGASGDRISDFLFSVAANADGRLRPAVTDKKGIQLPGERIPRGNPIKATSIEEIETITILRAKGSHYFVVMIAGESYRFDLPH